MDIPEPLRPLAAALAKARADGDAQAIAALYAQDGLIILPDGARLQGRAAIAAHYQALAASAKRSRTAPASGTAKWFFFPPIVHAITTLNGRHGEKHCLVDVFSQQPDGAYLLACSSWTLRQ
jgi:ketosteroid isomerase-like protein